MIEINIPGYRSFQFRHLVLDVNGTIAKDGQLIEGTKDLLDELAANLDIHMITADTHGRQEIINRQLNLSAILIPIQKQAETKLDFIQKLDADALVAIGNGANDALMLEQAALGIAVLGSEGLARIALQKADVIVPNIRSGLELLLYPKRLVATLRR
jgi:P-type E1-E2 ATPase